MGDGERDGQRHCLPCEGGLPRLDAAVVSVGLRELPGWVVDEGAARLRRTFRFRDFAEAMRFVNALAEVAEREGHHPDFSVHWDTVEVVLWTHTAGGLTENDLVLAALLSARPEARSAEDLARPG
jgi:4a-hydroxytetrahydrobiopterin dehydratase